MVNCSNLGDDERLIMKNQLREKIELTLIEVLDYAFDKGKAGRHNPEYDKAEKWVDRLEELIQEQALEERIDITKRITKILNRNTDMYKFTIDRDKVISDLIVFNGELIERIKGRK